MAVTTPELEPAWLNDELWLAEKEQPDGVTDDAPERDAEEAQQPQGVEQRSLGATELLLSLCIGLPQLAWMGFLAYLAYNIVRLHEQPSSLAERTERTKSRTSDTAVTTTFVMLSAGCTTWLTLSSRSRGTWRPASL